MMTKTLDEIIDLCEVLSNKHRLRIIAALSEKRKYTSELARELEISRPLLYLHLRRLEEVGILKGKTELGKGNRARRYYELCDFELCLNGKKIKEILGKGKKRKRVKEVLAIAEVNLFPLFINHAKPSPLALLYPQVFLHLFEHLEGFSSTRMNFSIRSFHFHTHTDQRF